MIMILVLLFLFVMIGSMGMGNFTLFWIAVVVFGLAVIFFLCLLFAGLSAGGSTPTPPSPPPTPKRHEQTEDEFNEMAITTMYANQWLDDN